MKQRQKYDCGIVAVAVAAKKTYKEVKQQYGTMGRGGNAGMEIDEVVSLLQQFDMDAKLVIPRKEYPLYRWLRRNKSGRHIVVYASPEDHIHASAVVDQKVFNPGDWRILESPVSAYITVRDNSGKI
jgi:hypothetical protein